MLSGCASGGAVTGGSGAPVPVTIVAPQGGTTGRASAGVTMLVGSTGQSARIVLRFVRVQLRLKER